MWKFQVFEIWKFSIRWSKIRKNWKNSKSYLGGAGIVAAHFASFSKNVTLTTLINKDKLGNLAKKILKLNKWSKLRPIKPNKLKKRFSSQYVS
mgnify:CR=1 FL=1